MRIADLEFSLLAPPSANKCGLVDGTERTLLVRLSTSSGAEGYGEARTSWRADEIAMRRESVLPVLAGRHVADVEDLALVDGLPAALRAAVEMACFDALGRAARQPLCRLWGGEFRSHVPVAVRLPAAAPDRTAQWAHDLAERGFFHQIVSAVGDVERDLAVIGEVRQVIGDRVKLRLDGGGRFVTEQARELCRQLEEVGLEFFLDPLSSGLDGLAALARQTTLPLAVSAAIRAPSDVLAAARGGAGLHVVIDVAQVGGLSSARKCAVVAAAAQLPASLRGAIGLGVGLAGVIQLAAAAPHLALAHECAGYQLYEGVLEQPLSIVDGMIAVPQEAGLGVAVDRLKVERYAVT